MISVSVVQADGQHANFDGSGVDVRYDVRAEGGVLVIYARDGARSVRITVGDPMVAEMRVALTSVPA